MKALVYKDLYLVRKTVLQFLAFFALALGIAFFLSSREKEMVMLVTLSVCGFVIIYGVYILMERLFYNEDKYKGLYFMKTLPLKTSTIISSKFITALILTVFFVVMSLLVCAFISFIFLHSINLGVIASALAIVSSLALSYASLCIYLFFAFGFTKWRQYTSYTMIALILAISLGPALLQGTVVLEVIVNSLRLLNTPYTPLIFLLGCAFIYALCCKASVSKFKLNTSV
jgi:hypothetical protein